MTLHEFLGWLDGYVEAGGRDVKKIHEKAKQIQPPMLPALPAYPIRFDDPPPSYPPYTVWCLPDGTVEPKVWS